MILGVKTRMEVSMKTTIKVMCVVAGTALLGWSGDIVSILQENTHTEGAFTVTVRERAQGGFDSPLAPPHGEGGMIISRSLTASCYKGLSWIRPLGMGKGGLLGRVYRVVGHAVGYLAQPARGAPWKLSTTC